MRQTILGMGVGLLASVLGASATAQDGRLPLDAPITLRLPATLPSRCGIIAAVARLSEASHVAMGFEQSPETQDCWAMLPRIDVTDDDSGLTKMTVRKALDQLMVLAPDFQWREMRGVAVIRPVSAWTDRADPLNGHVAPFQVAEATVTQTLATILRLSPTVKLAPSRRFDAPAFAMAFNGGTTVEALNELVRARGGSSWDASVLHPSGEDGIPTLVLTIRAFSSPPGGGLAMSAPISRVLAR